VPHCVARRFIGIISRVCPNDVFALCRSLLKKLQLMSSSMDYGVVLIRINPSSDITLSIVFPFYKIPFSH